MKRGLTKEISKEIYDNCKVFASGVRALSDEDTKKVFSQSELLGYGIYNAYVHEKDGKYFIKYDQGDSCD